jgi:exosome complex RNA-binding protein Rrp42 (RNase PH superfamily)
LVICESVLVGVVVECFKLGHDSKIIDLIFTAAKARLAKIRLEDIDAKGSG